VFSIRDYVKLVKATRGLGTGNSELGIRDWGLVFLMGGGKDGDLLTMGAKYCVIQV
jgi:hypothetical protein